MRRPPYIVFEFFNVRFVGYKIAYYILFVNYFRMLIKHIKKYFYLFGILWYTIKIMDFLMKYIRHIVLGASFFAIVGLYIGSTMSARPLIDQYTHLVEIYGLIALWLLYAALLATPLTSTFPTMPYRALYLKARRAIGVSAFFFGLVHGTIAFFFLFGGLQGLSFLVPPYTNGFIIAVVALLILAAMAATSFDSMVIRLGKWWKWIHRFVYLAGVFILIHALIFGRDFQRGLADSNTQFLFFGIIILLALQSLRLHRYFLRKYPAVSPGISASMVAILFLSISVYFYTALRGIGA